MGTWRGTKDRGTCKTKPTLQEIIDRLLVEIGTAFSSAYGGLNTREGCKWKEDEEEKNWLERCSAHLLDFRDTLSLSHTHASFV